MATAESTTNTPYQSYNRMWWLATLLLVFMAIVFLATSRLDTGETWVAAVRAFAEAAMVGALADWFAVTALFRRPLGLPIPHTAIVPNNKVRIGRSLGSFIQNNFLSEEVLHGQAVNITGGITRWLGVPENRRGVTRRIRRAVPRLLETVEEDEIRRFLAQQVEGIVRNVDICLVMSRVLRLLTANGTHEVVLDEIVKQGQNFFRANEDWFRQELRGVSPWFVPEFVDRKIFDTMLDKAEITLAKVLADRNHELRLRMHRAMSDFIDRLDSSPEIRERGEDLKALLLSNEVFRGYVNSVRDGLLTAIRTDLERDDSQLAEGIERMLESFVITMSSAPDLQERVNKLLRRFITAAVGDQSGYVADLVATTIESWDSSTLVTKLEEQVGQDLQYIRVNGTIVGGLVGVVLFMIERLIS